MLSPSDEQACSEMQVPLELARDRITKTLPTLDPESHAAIEWTEKKPTTT